MARRVIGVGITDDNGVARCPITGQGRGKMQVVAETKFDDGMIQSEIYEVLDCIFFDGMETDTYLGHYHYSNLANLTYSTDYAKTGSKSLKWEYDGTSNNKYWGVNFYTTETSNRFSIENLKGNTIKFDVDTYTTIDNNNGVGFYIAVYMKSGTDTSWQTVTTQAIRSGEQSYSLSFDVPSNATEIWVRFNTQGTSFSSGVIYLDNWKIYQI